MLHPIEPNLIQFKMIEGFKKFNIFPVVGWQVGPPFVGVASPPKPRTSSSYRTLVTGGPGVDSTGRGTLRGTHTEQQAISWVGWVGPVHRNGSGQLEELTSKGMVPTIPPLTEYDGSQS